MPCIASRKANWDNDSGRVATDDDATDGATAVGETSGSAADSIKARPVLMILTCFNNQMS